MDLDSASSMLTSVCSSKQASRRYAFSFPIILVGSKFTWKEVVELQMTMLGRLEVVIGGDNIMFGHDRHMCHLVSNPSLIFDKSSGGFGLNPGYSFEKLLVVAVVQTDFLICCSNCDSPPFLGLLSEVDARSNYEAHNLFNCMLWMLAT